MHRRAEKKKVQRTTKIRELMKGFLKLCGAMRFDSPFFFLFPSDEFYAIYIYITS